MASAKPQDFSLDFMQNADGVKLPPGSAIPQKHVDWVFFEMLKHQIEVWKGMAAKGDKTVTERLERAERLYDSLPNPICLAAECM